MTRRAEAPSRIPEGASAFVWRLLTKRHMSVHTVRALVVQWQDSGFQPR